MSFLISQPYIVNKKIKPNLTRVLILKFLFLKQLIVKIYIYEY